MANYFSEEAIVLEAHPKFKGVKIAKFVGKEQGSPIGSSILKIDPWVEIPIHTHDESIDSIYCIKGVGQVFRDGSWQPFSEGDYCFIPAAQEHGVRNTSDKPLRLFVVHCPPLF